MNLKRQAGAMHAVIAFYDRYELAQRAFRESVRAALDAGVGEERIVAELLRRRGENIGPVIALAQDLADEKPVGAA
jgi:hypothetical protein